jgi:microcin C transport system substrate-binding protein
MRFSGLVGNAPSGISMLMRPIISLLPILAFSFFITPVLSPAALGGEVGEGLAMHGAPKVQPGESFGYVHKDATKGGTLRQAATGSFDTLSPFSLKGRAAQGLNLVYDRLTIRSWDEPFTLYPLIAEKIDVPDDRSSIAFTLNPAAKFQDGSPITVDDVLFSFETLRDKGRPNMRQVYKLVATAEKTGDRGVTFTLSSGYDRETVMIIAMMPILSKTWWSGRDFDQTVLDIPNTSGPYRIASLDPGRQIVLERNPDYWAKDLPVVRGLFNFDRMVFDYFRDDSVAFESFKAGDLDLRAEYDLGRWASGYDFPARTAGKVTTKALPHGRVERMWGFIFNTRRAPFDDLRVRRALSLMIDYKWLGQNLFHGLYTPLASFYPNSTLAASGEPSSAENALLEPFRAELPPEVFGPAWAPPESGTPAADRAARRKADALLKEAGWIVNKDGKRVHSKTGKPLSFEILLGSPDDEKVALTFKRSLSRLGIDVRLRTLDSAAFRDRLMPYDYDMVLYFWQNSLSPGTEQLLYWGCDAAKQEGRFNYAGICSKATDSLAKAIPNVKTYADLETHTRALDRILTANAYAIPLFYNKADLVAFWAGVTPPPRQALYGNVVESWYFSPQNGHKTD